MARIKYAMLIHLKFIRNWKYI